MTKRKSKSAVRRAQSLAAQVRDLRLLVESRLQPVPAPAPEPTIVVEPEPTAPVAPIVEPAPEPEQPKREPTKVETAPKAAPEQKRDWRSALVYVFGIFAVALFAILLLPRAAQTFSELQAQANVQATNARITELESEKAELKAAQPMTVVVQGPTVVQTETVAIPVGVAGVSELTLTEYMSDTTDVGALIAVLDRDWESSYDLGHRGEWSGGGIVVECAALLWTDFHGSPPSTVEDVRREGGWGVYRVPEGWETPSLTAGRWICLAP